MLLFYLAALETNEERRTMRDLYETHRYRLTGIARSILANDDLAEDAVHNFYLSVILHKDKVFAMGKKEFMKWSVVVIKNKCSDLLRQIERSPEVPYEEADEESLPNDWVEVKVIHMDMIEKLIEHVAALDEGSRQVIEMKYGLNMSIKEIATELSLATTQVNNRLARARAKLKKQMESELSDCENL